MSDYNQRKMNELSLKVFGKHLSDLSRQEMDELKRHPGWITAAYGTDLKEFLSKHLKEEK